jgi:MoxR-like ATPase
MRAAKVLAALSGRDYTTPDDIQQLLIPVWAHRLVLSTQARSQGLTPAAVLTATRDRLPVE